jgi:hypothetical protein
MEKQEKIEALQNDIISLSKRISFLLKKQNALLASLDLLINGLDEETTKRYDRELASANWKKYSKYK